jgi:hypothetical protein
MKRILKLGINRYIHLDSYAERESHAFENFCVFVVVSAIGAIAVCAMLGVDITRLNNGGTGRVPVQHSTQMEQRR